MVAFIDNEFYLNRMSDLTTIKQALMILNGRNLHMFKPCIFVKKRQCNIQKLEISHKLQNDRYR